MGRAAVGEICRSADRDGESALQGFLASMVWGYGRVGYGPYRVSRVLDGTPDAPDRLREVAERAREQGGPAAFEWLAKNRLPGLGVAFATKYLFFCAAAGEGPPALILDRLVRDWMAKHADWRLSLAWSVRDYRAYVETLLAWGADLGVRATDLEMLIFVEQASLDPISQWGSSGPLSTPAASGLSNGDEAAVLDALEEAADAFAALPEGGSPEDADDFNRGLRQLRRIVLARRMPLDQDARTEEAPTTS